MITAEEIRHLAKANRLLPFQQEKHYVQTVVLYAIYNYLASELVFKGGTALFFFYGLDRFSGDLDFTKTGEVDYRLLSSSITATLDTLGISHETKEKRSLAGKKMKIKARGPLYRGELSETVVDLDISGRNDLILGSEIKEVVPVYDDIRPFSVPLMKKDEIASEKVRALMKRARARDLYDLAFLIRKGVAVDMALVDKKMRYYGEWFDENRFRTSVAGLERIWEPELQGLLREVPAFRDSADTVLDSFS